MMQLAAGLVMRGYPKMTLQAPPKSVSQPTSLLIESTPQGPTLLNDRWPIDLDFEGTLLKQSYVEVSADGYKRIFIRLCNALGIYNVTWSDSEGLYHGKLVLPGFKWTLDNA